MESKDEPLFTTSLTLPVAGNLTICISLLLVGLWFFLMGELSWIGGLFVASLESIPIYNLVRLVRTSVKSGSFYNDRFIVSLGGKALDLHYDDIRKVEQTSFLFASVLRIYLKRQNDPIILFKNTYSESLKVDMFSWLRGKDSREG